MSVYMNLRRAVKPEIIRQAASRFDLLDYGKLVVGSAGAPDLPEGRD
jgi:hypothetical protein